MYLYCQLESVHFCQDAREEEIPEEILSYTGYFNFPYYLSLPTHCCSITCSDFNQNDGVILFYKLAGLILFQGHLWIDFSKQL